jgi:hypothetical protein
MKKQHNLYRLVCVAVIMALGALMPACGGGGGGGGGNVQRPLIATFTPADPNPGPNTINMGGASSGANFSVRVQVTDTDDFFGAGFRVGFNTATARFVGFSSVGSLLIGQGVGTDFDAQINPNDASQVLVTATIQDNTQPAGIDVAGTQLLITLNFQATAETANNPITFEDPKDVQECPIAGQACNEISGALTWSGGTMSAAR